MHFNHNGINYLEKSEKELR